MLFLLYRKDTSHCNQCDLTTLYSDTDTIKPLSKLILTCHQRSGNHMRAISQEIPQASVTRNSLKMTYLNFHSNHSELIAVQPDWWLWLIFVNVHVTPMIIIINNKLHMHTARCHQMGVFSALLDFVRLHKGQWWGALMFSLIYAWTNGWVNNRYVGVLRRHRTHYDVTIMVFVCFALFNNAFSRFKLC